MAGRIDVIKRASTSVVAGPTLLFLATGPGGRAIDSDDQGGNPFASALIELASDPKLHLRSLESRLHRLTLAKSLGMQVIERVGDVGLPEWRFAEDAKRLSEKRRALVLVVSDYSELGLVASLRGAAHDEQRIGDMLLHHGFGVDEGIGPRRSELLAALTSFRRESQRSDIGIIYSTGHGVEVDGIVYLIPGDYPVRAGFGSVNLKRNAISVARIARAASARSQNLVFFGGCRTAVPQDRP